MKRYGKKMTALLCAGTMAVTLLTGCSSGGDNAAVSQQPESTAVTGSEEKATTVVEAQPSASGIRGRDNLDG